MSYRNLLIYQKAHELGVKVHFFSMKLPKYELYETGSQLRRASKSISANIVEGYGRRNYVSDYYRFLVYAHSSCDEAIEWIEYIRDCHENLQEKARRVLAGFEELGRMMNGFRRARRDNFQETRE